MKFKWAFFGFFLPALLWAQDTVRIIPEGKPVKWMVLRRLIGARALYQTVEDSVGKEGASFIFQDMPRGEYAVQYDMEHLRGFRFLYDGNPVEIAFDPVHKSKVKVLRSKVNALYYGFLKQNASALRKFKQFKRQYYADASEDLQKAYARFREDYYRMADSMLKRSEGTLAYPFIKAKIEAFPPELMAHTSDYVRFALRHYFDYNDLNDSTLYYSGVVYDRLRDYIFRIPSVAFGEAKTRELLTRTQQALIHVTFPPTRAEMLIALLNEFRTEDRKVFDLLVKLYKALPGEMQDTITLNRMLKNLVPVRGDKFPLETLKKTGKFKLDKTPLKLFIFYSSDCPHCQKVIPKIYKALKNQSNVQVIAVGLETNLQHWELFTAPLKGWTHLKVTPGTPKLYDEVIRKYFIEFTPTYFLTDKNLEIIEKTTGEAQAKKIIKYIKKYEPEKR